MKTLKKSLFFLLAFSLIFPVKLSCQIKEIPFTTTSKEASALFLEGLQKFENIEFPAAAQLFDKAIKADPEFAMAYFYRGLSVGGFQGAVENLNKAMSLADKVTPGEKYEIMFMKALYDGDNGKMKESMDWLLSNFPSDKRVQLLAGNYYSGLRDLNSALKHYTRATELDKEYALAYNAIGYAHSSLDNYPEAEKVFKEYISLIPDNANPYDSYAELLLKMGKYDESITNYKKAVELDPVNFINSIGGIGNNYLFMGDFNTARKYYTEYFEKVNEHNSKLYALYLKASSHVYEGNIEKALSAFGDYRNLVEKKNDKINLINYYTNVGLLLDESGKPAEATSYYNKIDELSKDLNLPDENLENIKTASMLMHLNNLVALKDLDKVKAELDKCSAEIENGHSMTDKMQINMIRGCYELQKGNWDGALGYLSKADNQNPRTWYYSGLAYKNKGDLQNAKKYFRKVAGYNVPSLDHALVREKAKTELIE